MKYSINTKRQTGFTLVGVSVVVILIIIIGLIGWQVYKTNTKPTLPVTQTNITSTTQPAPVAPTTAPSNKITDNFVHGQETITLTHDKAWQKIGPAQMKRTIGQRSFNFQVQVNTYEPAAKIGDDYLKRPNFGGNLKTATTFAGPHGDLFVLKNGNEFAYLSSCPATTDGFGCSPQLSDKNDTLFIALQLYVPGAQSVIPLDLTQPEDQQAYGEFVEILKSIQY